jgi:EAL domain-containing protein (putative c-di-GMP-specific phosphodiesterase class I)
MIDLGHNMGLQVVAEGVESERALDWLRSCGCDWAQGYHYSKPLPATEFEQWLRASETFEPSPDSGEART